MYTLLLVILLHEVIGKGHRVQSSSSYDSDSSYQALIHRQHRVTRRHSQRNVRFPNRYFGKTDSPFDDYTYHGYSDYDYYYYDKQGTSIFDELDNNLKDDDDDDDDETFGEREREEIIISALHSSNANGRRDRKFENSPKHKKDTRFPPSYSGSRYAKPRPSYHLNKTNNGQRLPKAKLIRKKPTESVNSNSNNRSTIKSPSSPPYASLPSSSSVNNETGNSEENDKSKSMKVTEIMQPSTTTTTTTGPIDIKPQDDIQHQKNNVMNTLKKQQSDLTTNQIVSDSHEPRQIFDSNLLRQDEEQSSFSKRNQKSTDEVNTTITQRGLLQPNEDTIPSKTLQRGRPPPLSTTRTQSSTSNPQYHSSGKLSGEEREYLLAQRYQFMRSQHQHITTILKKTKSQQSQKPSELRRSKDTKSYQLPPTPTLTSTIPRKSDENQPAQPASKDNSSQAKKQVLPTTMSSTTPWVRQFILSRPKDALLPVPREFLADGFNLMQLSHVVERTVNRMIQDDKSEFSLKGSKKRHNSGEKVDSGVKDKVYAHHHSLYKVALRLILDSNEKNSTNSTVPTLFKETSSELREKQSPSLPYSSAEVQRAAEVLYTLVHSRYVTSPRGLDTIRRMFLRENDLGTKAIFGRCPRVSCNGMPLLPMGTSNDYDESNEGGYSRKAMRYCCSCGEAFFMWDSKVDGSAWGPSFCHLFLMTHGSEIFSLPKQRGRTGYSHVSQERTEEDPLYHVPQIFGFKIHKAANINYPLQ